MSARDNGFALVELLASLVIFAMISLLIVSGIGTGRRVWERVDAATVAGSSIEGAQMLLRNRLEHMFPATRYDGSQPWVDFDGTGSALSFLAPPPGSAGPAALRHYKLSLTPSGDLVLSSISDVAANPNGPWDQIVLLRGVQNISFAYFGAAPPDNSPQWRFRWEQRANPPQLIRVRIDFVANDRRWWPDLLVKPMANIDSLCLLNEQTGHCRGRA